MATDTPVMVALTRLSPCGVQVRKMSHAALLVMMEQGLIEQEAVERTVCPVVVHLTELEGQVDYHTGAIAVSTRASQLPAAVSERCVDCN